MNRFPIDRDGPQSAIVERLTRGRIRGDHVYALGGRRTRMRGDRSELYGSDRRLLSGRLELQGGRTGRRLLTAYVLVY